MQLYEQSDKILQKFSRQDQWLSLIECQAKRASKQPNEPKIWRRRIVQRQFNEIQINTKFDSLSTSSRSSPCYQKFVIDINFRTLRFYAFAPQCKQVNTDLVVSIRPSGTVLVARKLVEEACRLALNLWTVQWANDRGEILHTTLEHFHIPHKDRLRVSLDKGTYLIYQISDRRQGGK